MGRCLFLLQLDVPCVDDTHGRPALSEKKQRWSGKGVGGGGEMKEGLGGEEEKKTVIGI